MAGYVDETEVTLEILTAIKRAGADMIVTYFSKGAKKAQTRDERRPII